MQLSHLCIIRRHAVIKQPKNRAYSAKKIERRGVIITNFNAFFCHISQLLLNFAPSL